MVRGRHRRRRPLPRRLPSRRRGHITGGWQPRCPLWGMAAAPSGEAGGNSLGAVRAWGVTKPLIGPSEKAWSRWQIPPQASPRSRAWSAPSSVSDNTGIMKVLPLHDPWEGLWLRWNRGSSPRCGTNSARCCPSAPPAHHPNHPLGCHRLRAPDRVIFDKLVQAWCSAAATASSPMRLLGHHHPRSPRRMDPARPVRPARAADPGRLRPHGRPGCVAFCRSAAG